MDNQTISKMFYTLAVLDGLAMVLITILAVIHDGAAIPAALQYLQDQPTILPAIAGALGVSHVIGSAMVQRTVAAQPGSMGMITLPTVQSVSSTPAPSLTPDATGEGPSV